MAKFLNRKEQVYDLKLTNYGKYLLSVGELEPVYYGFLDDNIIYDGKYAGVVEVQNGVIERMRQDSQYIESLTTFEDPENQQLKLGVAPSSEYLVKTLNLITDMYPTLGGSGIYPLLDTMGTSFSGVSNNYFGSLLVNALYSHYDVDVSPQRIEARADSYPFTALIGDAYLDGDTQNAPAWKVVALEGRISSSTKIDSKNSISIPQINIDVTYTKEIQDYDAATVLSDQDFRDIVSTTEPFVDNAVIKLVPEDLLIYGEEMNTQLLTENFEIEVFEVVKDAYPNSAALYCVTPVTASLTASGGSGLQLSSPADGDVFQIGVPPGYYGKSWNLFAADEDLPALETVYKYQFQTTLTSPANELQINIQRGPSEVQNTIAAINGNANSTQARYYNNEKTNRARRVLATQIGSSTEINLGSLNSGTKGNGAWFSSDFNSATPNPAVGIKQELLGGIDGIFCPRKDLLKRKYFYDPQTKIEGQNMTTAEDIEGQKIAIATQKGNPSISAAPSTPSHVGYFFDLLVDENVSEKTACKAASAFNKESYYVDLDFDCDEAEEMEITNVDIYGKVTEPEICL
tara:strand:+ start:75155 stop:76873 length:1719 start_codon:yes stop_codon:yes gene_type:complete